MAGELALLGERVDTTGLLLDQPNGTVDVRIGDRVLDYEVNLTILAASTITLTLADPDGDLFTSGLFDRAIDITVEGLEFRLARIERIPVAENKARLVLTFEALAVARARLRDDPKKAARSQFTRAEFARTLFLEDRHAQVVAPSLAVKVPVARPDRQERAQTRQERKQRRDQTRQPGFPHANPDDPTLKVKGVAATQMQLDLIADVIDVGQDMAVPVDFIDAAIATVIVESTAQNLGYGDSVGPDSRGAFQQRDMRPWNARDRMNVRQAARTFYEVAREQHTKNPGHGPAELAQDVQNSGNAGAYAKRLEEAQTLREQYGVEERPDPTITYYERYEFRRGQPGERENTWDCTGRLADEVQWYRWEHDYRFYFMSRDDLLRSRPRMRISDAHPALAERIGFTWDPRPKNLRGQPQAADMTFRVHLGEKGWTAPHGTVVIVDGLGTVISGKWVVATINRGTGSTGTVTLIRPNPALPEPRPQRVTHPVTLGAVEDRTQGGRKLSTLGGVSGQWAGTESIFDRLVTPFMAQQDPPLRPGSEKRDKQGTTTGGISEHWVGATRSYAIDYPTSNGLAVARALAAEFGWADWQPNIYGFHNFTVGDRRFRLQILWGALIDHSDHVHVGITAL
jgi:hypothetical protein